MAAIKNTSYNNFQVPENILEERKKAWNKLFAKYSAMAPGVELNVHTLQPEGERDLCKITEQRFPMRKSMSMVQYWVETGNLAHYNCANNPPCLTAESSTVQDDNLELHQNADSASLATSPSAEKHFDFSENSANKNTKSITASDSSIDTAAYILANNYVTKKVETIAIVKGSKVSSAIQNPIHNFSEICGMAKSKNHISLVKKYHSNKLNKQHAGFSQSILFTSYIDKITENMKNANLDKKFSSKIFSMSGQQENRACSLFFSDSDESQNPNIQGHGNVNSHIRSNLSKTMKRKKLYKRSDSPAEFTPVSENNLSLKTSRPMIEKYLPLRSSEHPALETPKVSSRFLARTRFGMTRSKKKLNQDQGSFLCTTNHPICMSHEILDPRKINDSIQLSSNKDHTTISNLTANQTISKDECIQKNNSHDHIDIMRWSSSNQPNEIDKGFDSMANTLSGCDDSLKFKFEIKPCQVVIERLPHKYYSSSSSKQTTENNKLFDTTTYYICTKNFIKNSPDIAFRSTKALKNNASRSTYSVKSLNQNTSDMRTHNFKTFGDIHIAQDKLSCKGKQSKCLDKKNSVYSLDKFKIPVLKDGASNFCSIEEILKKPSKTRRTTNEENSCRIKPKYVIVDSSSDESDLIMSPSINNNQLISKSRNPKKFSSKSSSHRLLKSKSETVGSFTAVEDNKIFKASTYKDSKENCSNGKEMKQKFKVRNMSIISPGKKEKQKSASTEKQLQTVNLANEYKQLTKSTHPTMNKYKNISCDITNDDILSHEFFQIDNNTKINEKSSKLTSIRDKLNILDNTPNQKKEQASHTSLNDNNPEFEFPPTNTLNDGILPSACTNVSEDLLIEKNESFTKPNQQRDGKPNVIDLVQIVNMVTRKISTKKRSSYEIDLSSDEECIIPLKKI